MQKVETKRKILFHRSLSFNYALLVLFAQYESHREREHSMHAVLCLLRIHSGHLHFGATYCTHKKADNKTIMDAIYVIDL